MLIGGEPFRIVRLTRRGAEWLDALLAESNVPGGEAPTGETPTGDGPNAPKLRRAPADDFGASEISLVRRLLAGGLLHPEPGVRTLGRSDLAVVIPVRDDNARLGRLLARLRESFSGEVIVIDDASADPDAIAATAASFGASLFHLELGSGPAAARNAARSRLPAPPPLLLAFVDSDALPDESWLAHIVGHFEDPQVGAVAPRVISLESHGKGAEGVRGARAGRTTRGLARYELTNSPLDLGPDPAIVGAHRRVSYVPSAALVCRSAALEDVGWFDPALRVGEDVDLVRRLEAAGWVVRYEPSVVVGHDVRSSLGGFVKQRFSYGASAAALDVRHPGTVAPFESGFWSVAAVAGLGLTAMSILRRRGGTGPWHWIRVTGSAGFAVATLWPARLIARTLRPAGPAGISAVPDLGEVLTEATSVVLRGQFLAAKGLFNALRRVWCVPLVAVSVMSTRARRAMAVGFLGAELARQAPHVLSERPGQAVASLAFGILDDLSYATGVWVGCAKEKRLGPLLPRLIGSPMPRRKVRTDGPSQSQSGGSP